MNGESAKEYKKALCECSKENIKALVEYIESQNDFITENCSKLIIEHKMKVGLKAKRNSR